ncbi:MAG: cbb3-type cytochrome c oxidase subunit II [Flavobacteriales bacterium]|nr:cbb3-type cytochrome c oxidase subunit II [Flavobacteriales bacterium]MBP9079372.1 cbb3-type cytochrome c oxidase subunit II [Flavobacteriales bacterium]
MLNLHKDHANLVNISLVVFALLSTGIAVAPALDLQDNNAPLPSMRAMTAQERRGLEVYVAEGCMGCHTQQVRNIEMDKTWGSRPSIPSDYYYSKKRMNIWQQSPSLLGSERTGPDLTNVGMRQASEAWQMLHLFDPRMVVKGSVMPRYGWLFRVVDSAQVKMDDVVLPVPEDKLDGRGRKVVATQKAKDLVAYLLSLKQAPLPTGVVPEGFLPSPGADGKPVAATAEAGLPDGGAIFSQVCSACHQADAKGLPGAFPALAGSPIVNDGNATKMIDIVLGGYDARPEFGPMPPQAANLTDEQIAAVINHVRSSFGNDAPPTTAEAVKSERAVIAPETAGK